MDTITGLKAVLLQVLIVILVQCGCGKYTGKVLLVGYDGFRWDYLSLTDTPNFDRFILEGTSAPFINNVFTSITFPSMYTIVTGLYPESHGIVGYQMYDPVWNATWGSWNTESRWFEDGEPVWVTAGRSGRRTASYMWLGSNVEIRGYRPDFWLPYNSSHGFEERVEQVVRWFSEEDVDIVSLYFQEPDSTGHTDGPISPDTLDMIRQMDRNTGYLLDRLADSGLTDQVNILLTSDHGMTATSLTNRTINLLHYVNLTDLQIVADEGAVANILPAQGRTQAVYQALKGAHPNMSVYLREDVPTRWHFSHHRRIHPIIAVADEGWIIMSNISNWPAPLKGMHGYDNALMSMKPFFLAKGPNIRQNYESIPFSQLDLYPLMCELLDVLPSPHNGSLEIVERMLQPSDFPLARNIFSGSARPTSPLTTAFLLSLLILLTRHTTQWAL